MFRQSLLHAMLRELSPNSLEFALVGVKPVC
jgi:hypothetical protein